MQVVANSYTLITDAAAVTATLTDLCSQGEPVLLRNWPMAAGITSC